MRSDIPLDWQLGGNVAINGLFSAAFPLMTAIYAVRGLRKGSTACSSKLESRLAKDLDIDAETLYENYSPLILLGYPIFSINIEPLGTLALLFGRSTGLIGQLTDDQLTSALKWWNTFSTGLTWITGGICVSALGIWSYRRQQRRQRGSASAASARLWPMGAPEVSLALFAVMFLPIVSRPVEILP